MSQIQSHSPEEVQLLALLREIQSVLTEAINSLDSKSFTKPETRYLGWAAVTVNRAADGYLILRESYRVDASKLLIRPILEAIFSSTAVMKKRGFLFRKAYTEMLEEKKFHRENSAAEEDFQKVLKEMEQLHKKADPDYPIQHKRVDVRYTAQVAEMLPVYEVAYATYCLFTHGAIAAASGQLNKPTDDLDTQFVIRFVIIMLELLQKKTPTKIPDLTPFLRRLPT